MAPESVERAYAAVGRAVVAAQTFELALLPIYQIFRMLVEPKHLKSTGGRLPAGSFKIPVRNVVKELASRGRIAPDLETRLNSYADDRHMLIHRWPLVHGLLDERTATGFSEIHELASRVESEARALTSLFVGYVVRFADPEWAAEHMDEYKRKMAELFQRVHLDV